jgi:hypothetical protein
MNIRIIQQKKDCEKKTEAAYGDIKRLGKRIRGIETLEGNFRDVAR